MVDGVRVDVVDGVIGRWGQTCLLQFDLSLSIFKARTISALKQRQQGQVLFLAISLDYLEATWAQGVCP